MRPAAGDGPLRGAQRFPPTGRRPLRDGATGGWLGKRADDADCQTFTQCFFRQSGRLYKLNARVFLFKKNRNASLPCPPNYLPHLPHFPPPHPSLPCVGRLPLKDLYTYLTQGPPRGRGVWRRTFRDPRRGASPLESRSRGAVFLSTRATFLA